MDHHAHRFSGLCDIPDACVETPNAQGRFVLPDPMGEPSEWAMLTASLLACRHQAVPVVHHDVIADGGRPLP